MACPLPVPRVVRLKEVPKHPGMNPDRFNRLVRPYVIQIPIDERGIGFDRLDLDV